MAGAFPFEREISFLTRSDFLHDPIFFELFRAQLLRLRRSKIDARKSPVAAETVAFVERLLTIDAAARPSAAELLASTYFDAVRDEARALFGDERVSVRGGGGSISDGGVAASP